MANSTIVLTDSQTELVDRLVATGRYKDASEAILKALHLLECEEAKLSDLKTRLQTGLKQARSGELADGSGQEAIRSAFTSAFFQART
ncbi:MAG: type II toxin-antitoxin system ParD family antitoxin [Paracoccaceae bacterium]|jgi:antitoxin ParD1/3/4|nr:type II toxin-antitoxin system ParD family antitoxin [Planctomycetota bacterium]MDP7187029.1 type II toxin-antitoxin system ParD family antitoxin [Paracoccaceae bacterium]